MEEVHKTENKQEQVNEKSIEEYNQYNAYLHLSGVFNLLIGFGSLIVALIMHFSCNEKWPKIREETIKVIDFSLIQIFIKLVVVNILFSSYVFNINFDSIFYSTYIFEFVSLAISAIFALIYYKQYKRAKKGRRTSYPFNQIALSKRVIALIEKLTDDKDDEPEVVKPKTPEKGI